MKKKIIITALSLMIASSTIIPAYAAEHLPKVDDYMRVAENLDKWSDQFVEECLSIPDQKERYLHIVRIVADNLDLNKERQHGEQQILAEYNEKGIIDIFKYSDLIVKLSVKCGLEAYIVRVQGNTIVDDAATNYWSGVYINDVLYLTAPMNIEVGDDFNTYALLPNGTYGVHVTEDPRNPREEEPRTDTELKFHVSINPFKGARVCFDSDGTLAYIEADRSIESMVNDTDKYYICENRSLIPTTLENMRELGYTGDAY